MEHFDIGPKSPKISDERKELATLEQTGLYVFHGSPHDIDQLEPREAFDTDRGSEGTPAIYASPKADYAIFMAMLAPLGRTSVGTVRHDDNTFTLTFSASRRALARLTDESAGVIYVLNKQEFEIHNDNPSELKNTNALQAVSKRPPA